MEMTKEAIYVTLDKIRERCDFEYADRICNYIEANIDEFLECYEEAEE